MLSRTALFRQEGALFSSVWNVVGFIAWCQEQGFDPVVDFLSASRVNSWKGNSPRNIWTEYFRQISAVSAEEAISRGDYFLFEERPTAFPVHEYSQKQQYREIFHENIVLSEKAQQIVSFWEDLLAQEGKILGVHARGTDMKFAKSHLSPPTHFQLVMMVDRAMDVGTFDRIFLATEDAIQLKLFEKRYGQKIMTTDSFRARGNGKIAHRPSSVMQWSFLLGFQVIRDAWLLSQCAGLVSGYSNVSEHAQVIRNAPYEINLQIRRPRVDIVGSSPGVIKVSNFLREHTVSRFPGRDFKIVDRSGKIG